MPEGLCPINMLLHNNPHFQSLLRWHWLHLQLKMMY